MTADRWDRQCRRKVRYADPGMAHHVRRERESQGAGALRVYRCGYCLGWHLTSQKKGRPGSVRKDWRRQLAGPSRARLEGLTARAAKQAAKAARAFAEARLAQAQNRKSKHHRAHAERAWSAARVALDEARTICTEMPPPPPPPRQRYDYWNERATDPTR